MLSIPMLRIVKHTWARVLWGLYAPVVTMVVLVTANHWVFDAATGALTAAISALAAHTLFARVRPDHWAFTPEEALPAAARAG
jgi:hypothetical protein